MERKPDIYHEIMPDGRHSTIIDGQRFVDIGGGPPINKKVIPIDSHKPRMHGERQERGKLTAEEIMQRFFK